MSKRLNDLFLVANLMDVSHVEGLADRQGDQQRDGGHPKRLIGTPINVVQEMKCYIFSDTKSFMSLCRILCSLEPSNTTKAKTGKR